MKVRWPPRALGSPYVPFVCAGASEEILPMPAATNPREQAKLEESESSPRLYSRPPALPDSIRLPAEETDGAKSDMIPPSSPESAPPLQDDNFDIPLLHSKSSSRNTIEVGNQVIVSNLPPNFSRHVRGP